MKQYVIYKNYASFLLVFFLNFMLINLFILQSNLFAEDQKCTYTYSGSVVDNFPIPCLDGDQAYVYIQPVVIGEAYNLDNLTISNSFSNYLNVNFDNATNSSILNFKINTQVNYLNFNFNNMGNFLLGLNNDSGYVYNFDTIFVNNSSVSIQSNDPKNFIDVMNINKIYINSNSLLELSMVDKLNINSINSNGSREGTLIIDDTIKVLNMNYVFLDTLDISNSTGQISITNHLSVNHLNGGVLSLDNEASLDVYSTNTSSSTLLLQGNNTINIINDSFVSLDIIYMDNYNNPNGNIVVNLKGGLVVNSYLMVDYLYAPYGEVYINTGPQHLPLNNYDVDYSIVQVFEAGGETVLKEDQELIVTKSLKMDVLNFSQSNSYLTLDGATGTIDNINSAGVNGNIVLQNGSQLTVGSIDTGLNSVSLYDSTFIDNGTNAIKINNIKMINSFFNSSSNIEVLNDLYIENSVMNINVLKLYNNIHIVLGDQNTIQNNAVFNVNSLEMNGLIIDVRFASTADIVAGKTTTYYIVDSNTPITTDGNTQIYPIDLPYWISYETVDVGNNHTEINLETTRNQTYEELVKESSFYYDDANTIVVAQNIDYIMSQGYITKEMDALITSLDLDTNSDVDMLSANISSLVPVQSIIYVSGIDAINTSTIGIISNNLLEKNYFDKTNKFWTDFEVSKRNGVEVNTYDETSWIMEFGYNLYFAKYFNFVVSSGISKSYLDSSNLEATYDGLNFAVGGGFLSDNNYYINIIGLFASYDSNNTRTDYIGNAATSGVVYTSQTIQLKLGKDFMFAEGNLKLNNYLFANMGTIDAPAYVESGVLAYEYKEVNSKISEYGYNIGITRIYDLSINGSADTSKKIDLKTLKDYKLKDEVKFLLSGNMAISSKSYNSSDTIVKFLGYKDDALMNFAQESSRVTVLSPDITMLYIIKDFTIEFSYTYVNALHTYNDNRLKIDIKYKF